MVRVCVDPSSYQINSKFVRAHVYLNPLPIFKLGCLFIVELYGLFIFFVVETGTFNLGLTIPQVLELRMYIPSLCTARD